MSEQKRFVKTMRKRGMKGFRILRSAELAHRPWPAPPVPSDTPKEQQ